jgi:hypothetical protein
VTGQGNDDVFDFGGPTEGRIEYTELICNYFRLLGSLQIIDKSPKGQLCDISLFGLLSFS